jgi:hypothetical protein
MRSGSARRAAARAATVASMLVSAGCSHMPSLHWPWHRSPPPPPTPVHELDVTGASADTYPQYWKRNTLLVDLSGATGSGSITLKPAEGTTWPVRIAFRVRPGAIGVLDVRGAERTLLPITNTAGPPVDLELTPGIYTPSTTQMTVSWGPG